MSSSILERFSDLTGLIYDAALDAALWPRVLAGVADALTATSGLFFTPLHNIASGGFAYVMGVPETFLQQYAARWGARDIWMQAAMSKGLMISGTVATDDELVPRRQLLASEYYKGFLRPANASRLCASVIFGTDAEGVRPSMISVYKPVRSRPFTPLAKEVARLLNPHLSRSLGMMYRLQDAEFQVASSRAAIDRLASAIILLGNNGSPVFINRAAQHILDERDGLLLQEAPGRPTSLAAQTPELTARIRHAIATALKAESAEVPHFAHGVRLPRSSGRPPLALSVSALSARNEFGTGSEAPGAIAFVYDTSGPPPANSRLLRDVYSLSEAEAAVVTGLCSGQSIAEIAKSRGVSEHTIKTQLDAAFAKTGTNRQADLIRIALAISSGAA
jgi:DNA-binding CsgD family transcriptional regulator